MTHRLRLALGLTLIACVTIAETRRTVARATTVATAAMPASGDYSYRVIGRARLVVVPLATSDVGVARLAWRRDGSNERISLLVGSEPERAPRNLNKWAYAVEETFGNRADAFLVSTQAPDDAAGKDPARTGADDTQFRAVCSSGDGSGVQGFTTTVRTDHVVTYRALSKLLDGFHGAPRHEYRALVPPSGAAPGFLTALDRLVRMSIDGEPPSSKSPTIAVPYVYNGAVYDLQLRRVRRDHNVVTGGRTYQELLRGDFAVVRRSDGGTTPFAVSYPLDGPYTGVPIVISFRESWWLTLEFQLDDSRRLPADSGSDAALLSQVRGICPPIGAAHASE